MFRNGILFLVVGPSGAGKDVVIEGARQVLDGDISFWFPRRYITRAADPAGEAHHPVSLEKFEQMEREGAFMMSWRAHGHAYGVPRAAEDALSRGRSVIVNASRSVVDHARSRWSFLRIMLITAPPEIVKARLLARGREMTDDIEARLRQAKAYRITGSDVREISNAATPDQAIARFVALLEHELISSIAAQEKAALPS